MIRGVGEDGSQAPGVVVGLCSLDRLGRRWAIVVDQSRHADGARVFTWLRQSPRGSPHLFAGRRSSLIRRLDAAVAGAGGVTVLCGQASSFAVHAAVPPVLDSVVAAIAQSSGNFGPALAHFVDHPLNHHALFGCDGRMIQRWLEILVESLSALLGGPELHMLRDANPVVGSLLAHQLQQELVLLRDPRPTAVIRCHGDTESEMMMVMPMLLTKNQPRFKTRENTTPWFWRVDSRAFAWVSAEGPLRLLQGGRGGRAEGRQYRRPLSWVGGGDG